MWFSLILEDSSLFERCWQYYWLCCRLFYQAHAKEQIDRNQTIQWLNKNVNGITVNSRKAQRQIIQNCSLPHKFITEKKINGEMTWSGKKAKERTKKRETKKNTHKYKYKRKDPDKQRTMEIVEWVDVKVIENNLNYTLSHTNVYYTSNALIKLRLRHIDDLSLLKRYQQQTE